MINKILKLLFQGLIIFIIFVIQKGLLNGLFAFGASLNLILVFTLFLLVFTDKRTAFSYGLPLMLMLELFSFYPPGFHIIALALSLWVTNFLLVNFFTNRSLYSIIVLTFILDFVYSLVFYSELFLHDRFINDEAAIYHLDELLRIEIKSLLINILTAILLFYILNVITKKVQPTFLIRSNQ